jgi:hypothetical protein
MIPTNPQTDRPTGRQASRQASRQTDIAAYLTRLVAYCGTKRIDDIELYPGIPAV